MCWKKNQFLKNEKKLFFLENEKKFTFLENENINSEPAAIEPIINFIYLLSIKYLNRI